MDVLKLGCKFKVQTLVGPQSESLDRSSSSRRAVEVGCSEDEKVDLDPLARQLSEAAKRADERNASMDRKALAALAERVLEKVSGRSFAFAKPVHDTFIPETDDPQLLARARQATDFLNGQGENPFSRLPRDDLSMIVYDEGGGFTMNERNAAWRELNKRDCEWTMQIGKKISAGLQAAGQSKSVQEVLGYYRSLPLIEQAQMPGNIEADLVDRLPANDTEMPEFLTSLMNIIAGDWATKNSSSVGAMDNGNESEKQGDKK